MDAQCDMYICLGAYANNLKYVHSSVPGHFVDNSKFIWSSLWILWKQSYHLVMISDTYEQEYYKGTLAVSWIPV